MKSIILHSVPSSVHSRLAQDVIVSRLQPNGRFVDTYVADLVDGDRFLVPQNELPPRSAEDIISWIGKNKIQWEWDRGYPHIDPNEMHRIEINKEAITVLFIHSYSHDDHALALREAVEYVMDQEEL